jgi:hypothetical protein|tara:strand:- start:558 stop:752 length:195 start_codon:yes stop_codon:yes gene_type:complete
MTRQEQQQCIKNYCDQLKEHLLTVKMPEDWDGFEIRQLIHDKTKPSLKMTGKRMRDYDKWVVNS